VVLEIKIDWCLRNLLGKSHHLFSRRQTNSKREDIIEHFVYITIKTSSVTTKTPK
jgi:hypothetical protein